MNYFMHISDFKVYFLWENEQGTMPIHREETEQKASE